MEIQVKFTAKQQIAFDYLTDDITTEVLFGGSAGGGKSWFGCTWLILNCIKYPETRWMMGRSKLKALKQTTLNTFFDICSDWNLTSDHYNYNAQSGEITWYNGSTIILKDLFLYPSDPNFDSLGSLEITGAFIDEVNQVTEKAKNVVSSRIRYKLDIYNLIPKLFMSCNPAKNWTYNEFYKKNKENKMEDYKQFIPALVTDNPHISKHYISQLQKMDEVSKKRLLYGQWEYDDKTALFNYDAIIDVFKDFKYTNNKTYNNHYITCDVARKGSDKAIVKLWCGFDVIHTEIFKISLINEIVDYIKSLQTEYKIQNNRVVVDGDGVGGGVVDYIKGCYDFVNNSRALNGENYYNLKTQCYFMLAKYMNDGLISIYNWTVEQRDLTIQELAVIKRKNVDKDAKLQIISKDEMKAMIGRSTDFSDALMMRMVLEISTKKFTDKITVRF